MKRFINLSEIHNILLKIYFLIAILLFLLLIRLEYHWNSIGTPSELHYLSILNFSASPSAFDLSDWISSRHPTTKPPPGGVEDGQSKSLGRISPDGMSYDGEAIISTLSIESIFGVNCY